MLKQHEPMAHQHCCSTVVNCTISSYVQVPNPSSATATKSPSKDTQGTSAACSWAQQVLTTTCSRIGQKTLFLHLTKHACIYPHQLMLGVETGAAAAATSTSHLRAAHCQYFSCTSTQCSTIMPLFITPQYTTEQCPAHQLTPTLLGHHPPYHIHMHASQQMVG